jgi:DNA-binding transcriptional LysR family regulator
LAATSPSWKRNWARCCSSAPAAACAHRARRCELADAGARDGGRRAPLAAALLGRTGPQAGTVRISASQPVACYLLPPLLARMREALPDMQVELVASNQVSNLLRREADIALRMVQPDQASLVAKRIGKVSLSACAHRTTCAGAACRASPPTCCARAGGLRPQ